MDKAKAINYFLRERKNKRFEDPNLEACNGALDIAIKESNKEVELNFIEYLKKVREEGQRTITLQRAIRMLKLSMKPKT